MADRGKERVSDESTVCSGQRSGAGGDRDGRPRKAEDDKIPDVSEIMKKAHGKGGLRATVTKDVKGSDWEDAAKSVKDWQKLGDALAKNKPEKGSAESWKKLTGSYNKTLKSLATAVEKKDATAAAAR